MKSAQTNDLSTLLYEVTKHKLLGQGLNVDILRNTEVLSPRSRPEHYTYILNGRVRSTISPKTHLRVGAGLTIAYANDKSEVIGVWGNEINLRPIDRTQYPGLFINTAQRSMFSADEMLDDIAYFRDMISTERKTSSTSLGSNSVLQTGDCGGGIKHYVEVAVAYDNTFCTMFYNDQLMASTMIQSLIDGANEIYTHDTCVQLSLVHLEGHCSDPDDPYALFSDFTDLQDNPCAPNAPPGAVCTPSVLILERFRLYWKFERKNVRRDIAFFFSGFEDGTVTIGRAFIAAQCFEDYGFGWVEGNGLDVFIHEMGHSLGGSHTLDGIMMPKLRPDFRFFSDVSKREIADYLDNDSTSDCVSISPPVCDSTCTSGCVQGKCIMNKDVPPALIPCTPLRGFYKCAVKKFGNVDFAESCGSRTEFVQRTPDPNDETIFCCAPTTTMMRQKVVLSTYPVGPVSVVVGNTTIKVDDYIQEASAISTVLVLETRLIRDCAVPTPTPRAAISPIPKGTPPLPDACENNFPAGTTFKCVKRVRIGRLKIASHGLAAKVFMKQRYGLFTTTVKSSTGIRIFQYGIVLSTDATLVESDLSKTTVSGSVGIAVINLESNLFKKEKVSGSRSCCGMAIYAYVFIKGCTMKSSFASCGTSLKKLRYVTRCQRVCRRKTFTVVPFSSALACPRCQDSNGKVI